MVKHIILQSCKECPYKETDGGFGDVVGVPYCNKGANMTYTVESVRTVGGTYRQYAKPDNLIPSDCPLENLKDV